MAVRRFSVVLLAVLLLIGGGTSAARAVDGEPPRAGSPPGDPSAALSSVASHGLEAVVPGSAAAVHLDAGDNRGPTGRLGPRILTSWVTAHRAQDPQRATPVLLRHAEARHRSVSTRLALARAGLLSRRPTAPPLVSAA